LYNYTDIKKIDEMAAILYAILNCGKRSRRIHEDLCYSRHVPGPFLKKSACYQKCPRLGLFWASALRLPAHCARRTTDQDLSPSSLVPSTLLPSKHLLSGYTKYITTHTLVISGSTAQLQP